MRLTSWARARVVTSRASGVVDHHDVVEADDRHRASRSRHDETRGTVMVHVLGPREHHQRLLLAEQRGEGVEVATSSQPNEPGTVATRPAAAAGSAMAWSIAMRGRSGHSSDSSAGSAAMRRSAAAKAASCSARRSSSTVGPDDEHAGVPPVAAGLEVLLGHGHRRLLDELHHAAHQRVARQLLALVDVAEGRTTGTSGRCRSSPATRRARRRRPPPRAVEGLRLADHVVGGEGPHHLGAAGLEHGGGQGRSPPSSRVPRARRARRPRAGRRAGPGRRRGAPRR